MLTEQTFMIADSCNLSCTYCWYEVGTSEYRIAEMTAENYDAWLKQCQEYSPVGRVNITGGEPLLRQDFDELLQVCHENSKSTAVFTNAVLVGTAQAARFAELGTEVHVSLDHTDTGLSDQVRGGTKATLRGIERIVEAGVRSLQICLVLTAANHRGLSHTIEFARDLGASLEIIAVAVPHTHPLSLRTLGQHDLDRIITLLTEHSSYLGRQHYYRRMIRFLRLGRLDPASQCAAAENGVFVNSNGHVWVCGQRGSTSLGNIVTTPMEEILLRRQEEHQRMRPGSCVSLDCAVLTY